MSKQLEDFLNTLQHDSNDEAKNIYGPKGYERWKNPKFHTMVERIDSQAKLTGNCGDSMEMFLTMDGERITDICFKTDGCASSAICGSFAAELAKGKTATEVLDMTGDTILNYIGKFPEKENHCAHLAITTVKEAINVYMAKKTR